MHADEAQEVGPEEDELEAMFKPKKKRKQERELSEKKQAVEKILARMEVRHWLISLRCRHVQQSCICSQLHKPCQGTFEQNSICWLRESLAWLHD